MPGFHPWTPSAQPAGAKGRAAPHSATDPKRLPVLALFLIIMYRAFAHGNAPRKTRLCKGKPSPK